MKKTTSTILFFCITVFCYGQPRVLPPAEEIQTEKLNQFDANGKKDGKWIVWLDKDWKLAPDSLKAVYFRYNYWDHGANLYPMGNYGGSYKLQTVSENSQLKKGNAKLLDGEYKWVNEKGQMFADHVLKEGVYVWWKEYFKNGNLETHFDYAKKCDGTGQTHSYYMFLYDKQGKLKGSYPSCADKYGKYTGGKGVDGGSLNP